MLRAILLNLSESKRLARFVMHNPTSRRVVRRFVAGETLDDAVAAVRIINQSGCPASFDCLGESVSTEAEAHRAADVYNSILDRIAAERLDANASLKLTQLGLDVNPALCESLVSDIVAHAERLNNFVRIDMEGSDYTQRTIDLCKRVHAKHPGIGTVVQSYLFRTEQDAKDLIAAGIRMRLVKGAYKEPSTIAYPKKIDVDANYVRLMKLLLQSGLFHAIATHDPDMQEATKHYAVEHEIARDKFEFQMLYGIRTDLQQQLIREQYRLRVYVPYGSDWFPYFMRRLAERPANLKFFLSNLFRRS